MRRQERLTKGLQFATVYAHGRTWANKFVVLRALPNDLKTNRCGFVTSKRLGKAVTRNRVKRLLREIVRITPTKKGWDLVFIARNQAARGRYQELRVAVAELLSWAGLVEGEGGPKEAEDSEKEGM